MNPDDPRPGTPGPDDADVPRSPADEDATWPPSSDTADAEARLRAAFEATADLPDSRHPLPQPAGGAGGARSAGRARRLIPRGWGLPLSAAATTAAVVVGALAFAPHQGAGRPDAAPTEVAAVAGAPQRTTADGRRLWVVDATVIQPAGKPAVLCVGVAFFTGLGTCTGPTVTGWTWDGIEASGSPGTRATMRRYRLVGTYTAPTAPRTGTRPVDFGTFTVTQPATPAPDQGVVTVPATPVPTGTAMPLPSLPAPTTEVTAIPQPFPLDADRGTPCTPPAGGWTTTAPTQPTDRNRLIQAAKALPDFADWWLDIASAGGPVLNASVTGDADAARARLERLWGGPLCVSHTTITRARLQQAHADVLAHVPAVLTISLRRDHVEANVVADEDGRYQRDLDRRYGAGVVRLTPALRPWTGDPTATPSG